MFLKVFVGVIFRKLVPIVSVVVIPFGDDNKALHEYVEGIFRKSAFYRIATIPSPGTDLFTSAR